MAYNHKLNGKVSELPVGKVVCVGRNYVEHAKELNNPVPSEPLLFIKSANTLVDLEHPFSIPADRGECHFETELALLIDKPLTSCTGPQALNAIAGVGAALDLTLRDIQQVLKSKGHPWEKAKSFDGACPVSGFYSFSGDLKNIPIKMWRNNQLQQSGNSAEMITSVIDLLVYISHQFSLSPGDIVLTGTPAGVGPLSSGDEIKVEVGPVVVNASVI